MYRYFKAKEYNHIVILLLLFQSIERIFRFYKVNLIGYEFTL